MLLMATSDPRRRHDMRQGRVGGVQRPKEVHPHDPFENIQGAVGEIGAQRHSRRADQYIQSAELFHRRLDSVLTLIPVRHVGRHAVRLGSLGGHFLDGLVQRLGVARRQDKPGTQLGQAQSRRPSDPGRSPCDQNNFAVEGLHTVFPCGWCLFLLRRLIGYAKGSLIQR